MVWILRAGRADLGVTGSAHQNTGGCIGGIDGRNLVHRQPGGGTAQFAYSAAAGMEFGGNGHKKSLVTGKMGLGAKPGAMLGRFIRNRKEQTQLPADGPSVKR